MPSFSAIQAKRIELIKALGPPHKECIKCKLRRPAQDFERFWSGGKIMWPSTCLPCGGRAPAPAQVFKKGPKRKASSPGYGPGGLGPELDLYVARIQEAFIYKGMALEAKRTRSPKQKSYWAIHRDLAKKIEPLRSAILAKFHKLQSPEKEPANEQQDEGSAPEQEM